MMKFFLRPRLVVCVLIIAALQNASAQGLPPKVTSIKIEHVGPAAVSDALVRANIRLKEGEPYLRASVDDDLRNLYRTGYFLNIRVGEEQSDEGVKITYFVQGKPVLTDIKFEGNKKYKNSRLLKKITSKTGEPLDERKLFSDSQEIKRLYEKAGYQKTTVKAVPSINEAAGRGSVTFEVTESPKVKIKDVEFEGNAAFKEKKLRKVIKTKRRWMFSWLTGSGVLKEDEFEDDKDRLIEFYQNEGYIDFEIKEIKFNYVTPTKMVVHFAVQEGSPYRVGDVSFKGNSLFSTNDIMQGIVFEGKPRRMRMNVGEIFTPVGLSKDIDAIKDFYGSKGYIKTEVMAVRTPNTTTGTMDLVYQINESEKMFIEKIEIKGNTKTKDRVLRRELAVAPGEVYDMVRVKASKARLEQTQFFDKVDTQSEDTEVPNRKNLVIGVEESDKTGNLTVGAGFNSVESVVGFVELSQGNFDLFNPPMFTGAGQKFRLRLSVGSRLQNYEATFIEPWFLDRKLELSVSAFHREFNYQSTLFDETHTGGSMSLRKTLFGSDFVIGKVGYTVENRGLALTGDGHADDKGVSLISDSVNPPRYSVAQPATISKKLAEEEGHDLVSKVGLSLAYDTRNSVILTDRGQRTEISGELAGGPFLGDSDFWKLELKSSWFFPGLFEGHILEISGSTGIADSYGDSKRVPIFDRFFLGGVSSLRGFRYRTVGPRDNIDTLSNNPDDKIGEPYGGNTFVYGTAEYSLPIIDRLRFALFYDVGNVYAGTFHYSTDNDGPIKRPFLYDNWGVGLRINLPIGPLRLDYGIPITADEKNNSTGKFQFSAGWNRNF